MNLSSASEAIIPARLHNKIHALHEHRSIRSVARSLSPIPLFSRISHLSQLRCKGIMLRRLRLVGPTVADYF